MNLNREFVEKLIRERHWNNGESVRSIERSLNIGKTTLFGACRRFGIKLRTKEEQTAITNRTPEVVAKRSGTKHWAWGRRKETDSWAKAASKRMSGANNPSHRSMEKMAKSRAITWREKPTKHEAAFAALLSSFGDPFSLQHAVGRYVIDFAWRLRRVGLEIDAGSRGKSRKAQHLIRDRVLVKQGWKIIRATNAHSTRPWHLLTVLKQYVPYLKAVSPKPPRARQYRVLVRDSKSPSGRKE